ncbi:hypothetical protein MNBD_GAMMA13-806 [hydrothermal vent metagenome]|uniref:Transmembrane protein n=1 Tax=hydrothermal vent metagenome TaxID=652676 RepID=A0A3B0YKI3_9ZZZZ
MESFKSLLAALILLCSAAESVAAAFPLDQLMQRLSRIDTLQVHFQEQKTLVLLEVPLTQSGTLTYRAPDYLKKQVEKPRYSLLEIEANRLHTLDGEEERNFSLDRHPALRAFTEAYRSTLAGDRATLERYYKIQPSGTLEDWQLLLLPKTDAVRKFIRHIRLSGTSSSINSVETLKTSGDSSLMTIFNRAQ